MESRLNRTQERTLAHCTIIHLDYLSIVPPPPKSKGVSANIGEENSHKYIFFLKEYKLDILNQAIRNKVRVIFFFTTWGYRVIMQIAGNLSL